MSVTWQNAEFVILPKCNSHSKDKIKKKLSETEDVLSFMFMGQIENMHSSIEHRMKQIVLWKESNATISTIFHIVEITLYTACFFNLLLYFQDKMDVLPNKHVQQVK